MKVAWSTGAAGKPVGVAADSRGEVVTIDRAGVAALDRRGNVLWAAALDGAAGRAPVLMADRVIVPVSRADGSGGCVGLDRQTGETRWRYEAVGTGGVAVAAAGQLAICVLHNGQSAGIPPQVGFPQWEFTFRGDVESSTIEVPARTAIAVDGSSGEFAFVARLGGHWQLTIRDAETGHTRLFVDLGAGDSPSAPARLAPGVFVIAASDPAEVDVVYVGSQRFERFPVAAAGGFDPGGAPVVVAGLLIVFTRSGEATAIDLRTARPRWTARSIDTVRGAHPLVVGNAVMLATASGGLVAFRLSDGHPIRVRFGPGRVIATLTDSGPTGVYAVGRRGGVGWIERWELQPDG